MINILNFSSNISVLLYGFLTILICSTIAFHILDKFKPSNLSKNLKDRVHSWWFIYTFFILLVGIHPILTIVGFSLISFISHREIISNIKLPLSSRRTVLWSYFAIPIQYYFVYKSQFIVFLTFIPVAMMFLLSLRTILEDQPKESLNVFSKLHWSLMLTTFSLSHMAYLVALPIVPGEENIYQALLFFLIFITQVNDIFQYISGKLFGKRQLSPSISPNKTTAGLVGGMIGSSVLAYSFSSRMPLSLNQCLILGVLISITGALGDLNISAIKRSLDIKDMSNFIPGHGGMLDRVDSLTFSAPLFFYMIYYWIYT